MTVYQAMQLNAAGSKNLMRQAKNRKGKNKMDAGLFDEDFIDSHVLFYLCDHNGSLVGK